MIPALVLALLATISGDACHLTAELRIATPPGHLLAGELCLPAEGRRLPVAILISGAGPQDRDYGTTRPSNHAYRDLSGALVARGIAVFRYDEVGTGRSSGDYGTYATTATLARDVEAIVGHLRERAEVDPDRIVLVGHSEGAAIAGIVAMTDERLAGVVLLAPPALPGATIMDQQNAWRALNDPTVPGDSPADRLRALRAEQRRRTASEPWFRHFLAYEPLVDLGRVRQPMLIIHGEDDWQVSPAQAHTIAGAAQRHGNASVTLHVLPGFDHTFIDHAAADGGLPDLRLAERVKRLAVDWIAGATAGA